MTSFVHLHTHSVYSLLDSAVRVADLPRLAKAHGMSAVALTDKHNLFGAIAFEKACKAEGIRPVFGCEIEVLDLSGTNDATSHLTLLVENETGYQNLCRLLSRSYVNRPGRTPAVSESELFTLTEGLICLSGCRHGRLCRLVEGGDLASAEETVRRYAEAFGRDRYYIEVQNHRTTGDRDLCDALFALSEKTGIPTAATGDVKYAEEKDAEVQHVLNCIAEHRLLSEGREEGTAGEYDFKSGDDMASLFYRHPEAVENTVKIAERCRFSFDFSKTHLPAFPVPDGENNRDYFMTLTARGFEKRIADGLITFEKHGREDYLARLQYEISVITEMGFVDYFLIVQDYVNYAKRQGIPVGPGRGSGAGSLVAYCLGITDIDPLPFDLLFERFLNPERVSMPDIDIDVCSMRRGEVLDYLVRRYGQDHVTQVVTFNTLASRAALRDVGRILAVPEDVVERLLGAIPRDLSMTLEKAEGLPEVQTVIQADVQARRMMTLAKRIEGFPRNLSVHAAGVVITERKAEEYLPLCLSGDVVITQYDKDEVADLGLLKFDVLGIRELTRLRFSEDLIRQTEPDFSLDKIPMDDPAVYEMLSRGKTTGLFQLSSPGMKNTLKKLQPSCFEDVVAVLALYRPGPMDSINRFIECRHHPERIVYDLPELEPILNYTYGCVVYQEQVMEIFRTLAGYTFGHADVVRRAMSKKKASVLMAEKELFVSGCEKNGIDKAKAEKLFGDMESFANYAFNKAHAAAYAVVSYRTAYVKCHYPQHYYAALLSGVMGDRVKTASYIAECRERGVSVLPPDVNRSASLFVGEGTGVRFALCAVKGVGTVVSDAIVKTRTEGGAFSSFEEMLSRLPSSALNKKAMECLILAGACDGFGHNRSTLLFRYDALMDAVIDHKRGGIEGQMDLFSLGTANASDGLPQVVDADHPEAQEFDQKTIVNHEREYLGVTFKGNPLGAYKRHVASLNPTPVADLLNDDNPMENNTPVVLCGVITSVRQRQTKAGKPMANLTLSDGGPDVETVVFSKEYDAALPYLIKDLPVVIRGNVSVREYEERTQTQIIVSSVLPLVSDDDLERNPDLLTPKKETPDTPTYGKVYLRFEGASSPLVPFVRALCDATEGCEVYFYYADTKTYDKTGLRLVYDSAEAKEVTSTLGEANAVFRK